MCKMHIYQLNKLKRTSTQYCHLSRENCKGSFKI